MIKNSNGNHRLVLYNPFIGPLSGATTPGQSGPRSNGNKRVLHIPQISSNAGSSPSDCFVSYPGHLLAGSYPSAGVQSVYSTAPADWAKWKLIPIFIFLQLRVNVSFFLRYFCNTIINFKAYLPLQVSWCLIIDYHQTENESYISFSAWWLSLLDIYKTLWNLRSKTSFQTFKYI